MTTQNGSPTDTLRSHMLSLVAQRAGVAGDTETAEALRVLSTDAGISVLVQLVADGRQWAQNVTHAGSAPVEIVYTPDTSTPDVIMGRDMALHALATDNSLREDLQSLTFVSQWGEQVTWVIADGDATQEAPRYDYVCFDCGAVGTMADSLEGDIKHCPECGSSAVDSTEANFAGRVHRGRHAPDPHGATQEG